MFMAIAVCSSCKKDQKKGSVPPAETHKVNFNVSDFTETLVDHSTNKTHTDGLKTNATQPLSSFIDEIYYFVFDKNGKFVHYFEQLSSASNFGSVSDELPAGTYTVVFAAGKSGLLIANDYSSQFTQTNIVNFRLAGYGSLPWLDTFFDKFQITVTKSDITQSITLDRIVSQLTVNVLDAIPANAYRIQVTAISYKNYYFSKGLVSGESAEFNQTFIIPAAAKGTTNYKVSLMTLNTETPSIVIIKCFDSSGAIMASASVNNVVVHANTQTILTGNLFNGVDNKFGITVNAKWDAPIFVSF